MSTQSQMHNGGAVAVVIDDDGRMLYPGDTAPVQMTSRVASLLASGALTEVQTNTNDDDESSQKPVKHKPARARESKE